jgi:hypothetical protein
MVAAIYTVVAEREKGSIELMMALPARVGDILVCALDARACRRGLGRCAQSDVPPGGKPAQATNACLAPARARQSRGLVVEELRPLRALPSGVHALPSSVLPLHNQPSRRKSAWIEPDVPPLGEAVRQVRFLASLPGGIRDGGLALRPDRLLGGGRCERSSWDAKFFERMCRQLAGMGVTRCITSLANRYAKFEQRVRRTFPQVTLHRERRSRPDEKYRCDRHSEPAVHAQRAALLPSRRLARTGSGAEQSRRESGAGRL